MCFRSKIKINKDLFYDIFIRKEIYIKIINIKWQSDEKIGGESSVPFILQSKIVAGGSL